MTAWEYAAVRAAGLLAAGGLVMAAGYGAGRLLAWLLRRGWE